jgi:uncharacterized membrane protein YhaH (DUF805 family)
MFAINGFILKLQITSEMIRYASLLIILVLLISLIIAIVMICIKRLHDTNHRGKWLFLIFVPIANIYLLYLLFLKKGDIEYNRYNQIN